MTDPDLAIRLAVEAGALLRSLRAEPGAFDDPKALGARGDRTANEFILGVLAEERPDHAVLSEESADDLARLDADNVWIIDPLDGTREYGMAGREDWAVHIALWQRHARSPELIDVAAVSLPAVGSHGTVYSTAESGPVVRSPLLPDRLQIVVSGSRPQTLYPAVAELLDADIVRLGSAGAKTMAVVRGEVDIYLHTGGQWAWDSAAPISVARAHGLHVARLDGSTLRYNQHTNEVPDLVVCAPAHAERLHEAIRTVVSPA